MSASEPGRRRDADGVTERGRADWLDGWRGTRPSARRFAVSVQVRRAPGLPDGDGALARCSIDDGVVAEVARRRAGPAPDLTLTVGRDRGRGHGRRRARLPSAAFMQGRMKTAGDPGLVLDVLAAVDAR